MQMDGHNWFLGARRKSSAFDLYNSNLEQVKRHYDLDNDLLIENLKDLKNGKAVEVPTYDYASHTRSDITIDFKPKDVIIVDVGTSTALPFFKSLRFSINKSLSNANGWS
jgi:uridine kinase